MSFIINEMQIKTTMIRISIIKMSTNKKRCTECGELLHCSCVELLLGTESGTATVENSKEVLKN